MPLPSEQYYLEAQRASEENELDGEEMGVVWLLFGPDDGGVIEEHKDMFVRLLAAVLARGVQRKVIREEQGKGLSLLAGRMLKVENR